MTNHTPEPELDNQSPKELLEIAQCHLKNSDADSALMWLKKIDSFPVEYAEKYNKLLFKTYNELGDLANLYDIIWKIFRANRTIKTLNQLLYIIGENQKENIINSEIAIIRQSTSFSITDALFLIDINKVNQAEAYIVDKKEHIDPKNWKVLLSLVHKLEQEQAYLAVTIIYRILLENIFERALTRDYPQGRIYLRKLGELSGKIDHWRQNLNHSEYVDMLYQKYENRKSFWRND